VTAQESSRHRCVVIGEDLGTVPENFRETLADWGIWSYQVMMFERDDKGAFNAPNTYREKALVTFTTHDLPTFTGWTTHRDLAIKRQLGIDPGNDDEERNKALAALRVALRLPENSTLYFSTVARYLANTPSRLLVVTMEDALGIADQPNVPGTIHEYPNWRRRLSTTLEDMSRHSGLAAIADAMSSAGRKSENHSR
jgi:4-alpha-glucanotransferase